MTAMLKDYEAATPQVDGLDESERFAGSYVEFLASVRGLEELLKRENALLRAGQAQELDAQSDRKQELAGPLRALFAKMLERPEFLQGEDNANRDALVEHIKQVQKLLSENRLLLNASKVATYRRIEAAVEARRQLAGAGQRYESSGVCDAGLGTALRSAVMSRKI